jgi:hypothetical protein
MKKISKSLYQRIGIATLTLMVITIMWAQTVNIVNAQIVATTTTVATTSSPYGGSAYKYVTVDSANANNTEDSVSQNDKQEYASLNFEQKFGLHFQPHKKVCSDTTGTEAHCNARVVINTKGAVTNNLPDPSALTPAKLLKAYNLTGLAPTSTIIAVVDAYDDPNIASDLATYSAQFGLPVLPTCNAGTLLNSTNKPCFQKVNQRGVAGSYPNVDTGWALETSLDVEASHAVCKNCSILLVEADSSSIDSLGAAVDKAVVLGAKAVSNSYGASEFSTESTYDSHFNHPGVAITVSSGDSGYDAEYPASSRYVTAVGGTSLFLNSDGSYNTESAWSGSGSGCSTFESKQIWQVDSRCSKRTMSDVSAVADPNTGMAVYDSLVYFGQKSWFKVGGTSLSAPIIAATYALSGNIQASTTESSLIYSHASSSTLHDIISGKNVLNTSVCGNSYLCTALVGYDGPTGLGTPKGAGAF